VSRRNVCRHALPSIASGETFQHVCSHHFALGDGFAACFEARHGHQSGGAACAGGAFRTNVTAVSEPTSLTFSSAHPFLPRQFASGSCGCPGRFPCFRSARKQNHLSTLAPSRASPECAPASLAEQHTARPCPVANGRSIRNKAGRLANVAGNIRVDGTHCRGESTRHSAPDFFSRNSTEPQRDISASSSIWDSPGNVTCAPPNPR